MHGITLDIDQPGTLWLLQYNFKLLSTYCSDSHLDYSVDNQSAELAMANNINNNDNCN